MFAEAGGTLEFPSLPDASLGSPVGSVVEDRLAASGITDGECLGPERSFSDMEVWRTSSVNSKQEQLTLSVQ